MPDDRRELGAPSGSALGRIALKQVRVPRVDPTDARTAARNRLVPFLDLFARLSDDELSRLAEVPAKVVVELRVQIEQVRQALGAYADLLPRLSDGELSKLTAVPERTIRFWRLCELPPSKVKEGDAAADRAATDKGASERSSPALVDPADDEAIALDTDELGFGELFADPATGEFDLTFSED